MQLWIQGGMMGYGFSGREREDLSRSLLFRTPVATPSKRQNLCRLPHWYPLLCSSNAMKKAAPCSTRRVRPVAAKTYLCFSPRARASGRSLDRLSLSQPSPYVRVARAPAPVATMTIQDMGDALG